MARSHKPEKPIAVPRLSIRLDLSQTARIGPGKIQLLEEIAKCGSISGGGRALKMSYRKAWELIEEMNQNLGLDVVETATGGPGGGGTQLTQAGKQIVYQYRSLEKDTASVAQAHIACFLKICKPK